MSLRKFKHSALALLGFHAIVRAKNCPPAYLQTQADADGLSACETITGSIVISKSFQGDLTLPGVQSIQGNFSTEPCEPGWPSDVSDWQTTPPDFSQWVSRNCTGLVHLIAPNLNQVSQNVSLVAQLNLSSVTFPQLKWVGTALSIDGMPALQSVNVPELIGFERFSVFYAPLLQNITVTQNAAQSLGDVSIGATGVPNLDSLFTWSTNYRSISLAGITNVPAVNANITGNVSTVSISGNGLTSVISSSTTAVVNSFSISGVGSFAVGGWAVDSLDAVGNSLTDLNIAGLRGLVDLDISNNPDLQRLYLPAESTWSTVAITGNPVLDPNDPKARFDVTNFLVLPGGGTGAIATPISSMEFQGNFETDFFDGITNRTPSYRNIDGNFEVVSTNLNFSCSSLSLGQTLGYIQGQYSCQGAKTYVPNAAGRTSYASWVLLAIATIYTLMVMLTW